MIVQQQGRNIIYKNSKNKEKEWKKEMYKLC